MQKEESVTSQMNSEDLNKLEELCEKATPGPWFKKYNSDKVNVWVTDSIKNPIIEVDTCQRLSFQETENNAEFIAAARSAVPLLIAEVKRLSESRERLVKLEFEAQQKKLNLQSKLTVAREALELIAERTVDGPDAWQRARQALKSIEEG